MDRVELLARVEKATGPDLEIDARLDAMWQGSDYDAMARDGYAPGDWEAPRYTASIDSALDLVERMLPGCDRATNHIGGAFGCTIWPTNRGEAEFEAHKETEPLSILLALLRALARESSHV